MIGTQSHNPQVDGLRALAIAAVLYAHFFAEETMLGHFGVRLFFVLSGYLITRILLGARDADQFKMGASLKTFYARRVLRIFPAYYLMLLLSFGLGAVEERSSLKWFVLYLSNFLYSWRDAWNPWVVGHSWTLAIEEQFYALWPLLVFFVPRHRLVHVFWGTVLFSVAYRFALPLTYEPNLARDLLPPASFDALAVGGLLALHRSRAGAILPRGGPIVAALMTAIFAMAWITPVTSPSLLFAKWVVLEIVPLPLFVMLIAGAVRGFSGLPGVILAHPAVCYVGRISYGMYLYHFIVLWIALRLSDDWAPIATSGLPRLIVCTAGTLALATLSWFAVEKPVLKFKSRFPYPKSGVRAEKQVIGTTPK